MKDSCRAVAGERACQLEQFSCLQAGPLYWQWRARASSPPELCQDCNIRGLESSRPGFCAPLVADTAVLLRSRHRIVVWTRSCRSLQVERYCRAPWQSLGLKVSMSFSTGSPRKSPASTLEICMRHCLPTLRPLMMLGRKAVRG